MPLDPNGPLTQYRTQIDLNEAEIATKANAAAVIGNVVVAAYGGIGANGPDPQSDITSTWQNLVGWDQAIIATPRKVIENFAAGGIQFEAEGIYNVYFKVSLSFNEANQGRTIRFRLLNQSTGTPVQNEYNFFVGRNTGGVNAVAQFMALVPVSAIMDLFVLQFASDDGFANVVNVGSIFQAFHISELQGGGVGF